MPPLDIFNFICERERLLRIVQDELETHLSDASTAEGALRDRITKLKALALSTPSPVSPETGPKCINCGDTKDGGYELEDTLGPLCGTCMQRVEDFYAAVHKRPSAAPVSEPPKDDPRRREAERLLWCRYENVTGVNARAAIRGLLAMLDERPAAAPVSEEMDTSQITKQLEHLRDKWRAKAATTDTFHATMGIGWKQCADELDTLLSVQPAK